MENDQVNTEKIYEITNEINSIVQNIITDIETINNSCNSLIQNCTDFTSYHGQEVMGSRVESAINKELNGEQVYSHTEITWKEWSISGGDDIISCSTKIQDELENIKQIADDIVSLTKNNQAIADYIETQINELQNILGNYTNEEIFIGSGLLSNVALDEYSAADNNWVGIKDENIKYWTDNPLRFTRVYTEDGRSSYRIDQQDENGNWVGMGFTDGETAYNYLKGASKDVAQKKDEQDSILKNIVSGIGGIVSGSALAGVINIPKINDKGELIFEFDPSKNQNHLKARVVNLKNNIYTNYYQDTDDGKISEVHNQNTGTTKTLYYSKFNPEGKKEEVLNADGSSVIKYNPSVRNDGLEKEVIDKDGNKTPYYLDSENKDSATKDTTSQKQTASATDDSSTKDVTSQKQTASTTDDSSTKDVTSQKQTASATDDSSTKDVTSQKQSISDEVGVHLGAYDITNVDINGFKMAVHRDKTGELYGPDGNLVSETQDGNIWIIHNQEQYDFWKESIQNWNNKD